MVKIISANDYITVVSDQRRDQYPSEGSLSFPLNSLIVEVQRDTQMVLFRSASNFDVLFQGVVGELEIDGQQVTLDTVVDKFSDVQYKLEVVGGTDTDLSNYWTRSQSDERYASKDEYDTLKEEVDSIEVPSLEGYATEQWVEDKKYLTQHQSLEDYATLDDLREEVDGLWREINGIDVPDVSDLVSEGDLREAEERLSESILEAKNSLSDIEKDIDYMDAQIMALSITDQGHDKDIASVRKDINTLKEEDKELKGKIKESDKKVSELEKRILDVEFGGVDTTDFLTESKAKNVYLTKAAAEDVYATKDDLKNVEVDLSGYATEEYVDNAIADIDTSNLVEKAQFEAAVTNTQAQIDIIDTNIKSINEEIDALDSDIDRVDKRIDSIEIPSLDGYATESYVNQQIEKIEIPSLDGYATESYVGDKVQDVQQDVDDALGDIASIQADYLNKVILTQAEYDALQDKNPNTVYLISDAQPIGIPSLDGYATEQYVNQQIEKIDVPTVDLDPYLTKESAEETYQPKGDYVTTVDMNDKIAQSEERVESQIPSLDGYATEQWVDDLLKNIPTEGVTTVEITQAEYNTLDTKDPNTLYLITDAFPLQEELFPYGIVPTTQEYVQYYAYSKKEVDNRLSNVNVDLSGYATEEWVNEQGYLKGDSEEYTSMSTQVGDNTAAIVQLQNQLIGAEAKITQISDKI